MKKEEDEHEEKERAEEMRMRGKERGRTGNTGMKTGTKDEKGRGRT